MPPKKDKGKAIQKPTEATAQPKAQTQTPPKEKLLSSAMPVKSWIDMVKEEEEEETKSKAVATELQVKEWMDSISSSPELMLALQKFSQSQTLSEAPLAKEEKRISKKPSSKEFSSKVIVTRESQNSSQIILSQSKLSKQSSEWVIKNHFQNILTMEDEFFHQDPFMVISKIFPKGWFFKPWDLSKPQSFYMSILEFTESVKFKHFFQNEAHTEPAYSTATINKILSPKEWGQPLHQTKAFPASFKTRLNHSLSFSYWDYQQAWFNTFLIQNPTKTHSWLFFFNTRITIQNLPLWFLQWWDFFGPSHDILTNNAQNCIALFKLHYSPTENEKRFPPLLIFCSKFFLPWVLMWDLEFFQAQSHFILRRKFKTKWWTKFDEESKLNESIIKNWLSSKNLLNPPLETLKAQSIFLSQRSHAQALLASAKTEEEYFKIMEQLLKSKSEASSSGSINSEPIIDLGDDNEDDCFGII